MTKKEDFLKAHGFRKAQGFALDTKTMNPNDYDEIFFEGRTLEIALKDYFRKLKSYWIYEPSNGEQVFEDIDDAIEYAEENLDAATWSKK